MNTTTTSAALPADLEALLRQLRLPHARAIAADVLATARAQRWDPTEVIKALLTEETAGRARSMLASRRKAAGFPTGKTVQVWDPGASSIPLPTQQALQTLEWVGRRENLVVCGPAGTGKTFFLEALGQKVIEAGMPLAWFTLEQIGVPEPVNLDEAPLRGI
jgi:DNA replication protein DnaC